MQLETHVLDVVAAQYRGQVLFHAVRGDIGQKSQAPAIDAQQGYVQVGQHARGAQHGAVAAYGDGQVAAGQVLLGKGGAQSGFRQQSGAVLVQYRLYPAALEEFHDRLHGIGDDIRVIVGDQCYGLEHAGRVNGSEDPK